MVQNLPQATERSPRLKLMGALTAAGVAVVLAACSVARDGAEQQRIADGTPDSDHESVFLLVHHDDNSGGLCTATLIAPNLLLTARHCVSPGKEDEHVLCGDAPLSTPFPASSFFATNDAQPSNASQVFRAEEVRVPRDEVDTCGYDIALLILSENVPRELSEPAVPRIDREVAPGETYTAVGYGVDESGDPTGRRMQRAGLSVDCEPGSCGDGVEASEFRGETGICSGDSGGPALDADGKVVGVVSRGGPDCSTPVYGTVTAWQKFLIETGKEAAELGGYEPPFWVTTGLSDPPLVLGEGGAGGGAGAGSAGEPPSDVPAVPLHEGDACNSASSCDDGLLCYAAVAGGDAECTRTCEETQDCAAGRLCREVEGRGVCLLPAANVDERSGCTVSAGAGAPERTSAGLAWLLAACAALGRTLGPRYLRHSGRTRLKPVGSMKNA